MRQKINNLVEKLNDPVDFGKWIGFFKHRGLKTKLVLIMLALSFASVMILFTIDSKGVGEIAAAIQSQNEDLSQAFQISVDEITTQGFTNQARLQDFINTLKRKGVREISILSNERQVLESSNPQKVGKVLGPRHKDFLVTGTIGDDEGESGVKRKTYNLIIPVVVKNEQLGYINLKLHLEDLDSLMTTLRVKRIAAIILIFALGVASAIFFAARYTKPIGELVDVAKKVSSGDLSQKVKIEKLDEIGELSTSFNEMVDSLKEKELLQQQLTRSENLSRMGQLSAGIAHEIRNPLNYLSLALDQLRDGLAKGKDPEKMKDSVSKMKQEVLRLSYLVKNFLNYGKPIKLDKRIFDAAPLIEESLRMINDNVVDQSIDVKCSVSNSLKIFGDREHIKSCITNVLLNAVQATPTGGVIEVTASDSKNKTLIEVKDSGCGINKEDIKKIGEPFFTTKDGGVGIGLALTKKILLEHEGSFEIFSSEGEGTRVKITVPAV